MSNNLHSEAPKWVKKGTFERIKNINIFIDKIPYVRRQNYSGKH